MKTKWNFLKKEKHSYSYCKNFNSSTISLYKKKEGSPVIDFKNSSDAWHILYSNILG